MRSLPAAICLVSSFAGPAMAEIPFLNATCPTGIDVHADQGGAVYINGEEATVQSFSDSYYEAKSGGTYVEIGVEGGSVSVTYTAPGGANGVCQVTDAKVGSGGGCPADVSEADRYRYPACN